MAQYQIVLLVVYKLVVSSILNTNAKNEANKIFCEMLKYCKDDFDYINNEIVGDMYIESEYGNENDYMLMNDKTTNINGEILTFDKIQE